MPKPLFTTKHYKAIGGALRTIGIYARPDQEAGVRFTIDGLMKMFANDNPNFKNIKLEQIVYRLNKS